MITSGGSSGARWLRLADGLGAALSDAGTARLRFTTTAEVSNNGQPYAPIGTVDTYSRFWVHPQGDDATGGPDIVRPFEHIQAAVTAALAYPANRVRITVAPAVYSEEITANVPAGKVLVVDGPGAKAHTLAVASPAAGVALCAIRDLELGDPASLKPALGVSATGTGELYLQCSNVEATSSATQPACDASALPGSKLNINIDGGMLQGTSAFAAALVLSGAECDVWHCNIEGTDRPPVLVNQDAAFISTASRVAVSGLNQHCINMPGNNSMVLLFDSICETDPASTGHAVNCTGVGDSVIWRNSTFSNEAGTGGINNPGGPVVVAGGGVHPGGGPAYGALLPIVSTGTQFWQMGDTTGYLNTLSGLTAHTLQGAVDELVLSGPSVLYRQYYVDPTATPGGVGSYARPFNTLSAAIAAATASPQDCNIHLAPAYYAEDVVVPAVPLGQQISLFGMGADVSIRKLTIMPCSVAGQQLRFRAERVGFHGSGTSGTPLVINGGQLGALDFTMIDCVAHSHQNGADACEVTVGAGGEITMTAVRTAFTCYGNTDVRGLNWYRGRAVLTQDCSVYGHNRPAVLMGDADVQISNGLVHVQGIGGAAIQQNTLGPGKLSIFQATVHVDTGGGPEHYISGGGNLDIVLALVLLDGTGSGGINVPNGILQQAAVARRYGLTPTTTMALGNDLTTAGQIRWNSVGPVAGAYTVQRTDFLIRANTTAGVVDLQFPAAVSTVVSSPPAPSVAAQPLKVWQVVDERQNAGSNRIRLLAAPGDTINGGPSTFYDITTDGGAVWVYADAVSNNLTIC